MADQACPWHPVDTLARRCRGLAGMVARVALLGLLISLSACMGHDIEAVRHMEAETGDSFTQTLAVDYRRFSLFEADEMFDWIDAGHFAVKGLRAGAGEEVEPEHLEDWRLPADAVPQLQEARATLLTALQDRSAGDEAARFVARAQANFDCWVEQQEENHQWDDIAACRDGFYNNLDDLSAFLTLRSDAATTPVALPERPAEEGAEESVPLAVALFAFDSSVIDDAANTALAAVAVVAGQADRLPEAAIVVVGHTDRRGTDAYNLDLSLRRAEAVRSALIERGVEPDRIDTVARGEWDPAVPTADGVAEPANRRVEVFVVTNGGAPALTSQETQIPIAPAGADAVQGELRPRSLCGAAGRGERAVAGSVPRDGQSRLGAAQDDCSHAVPRPVLGQQSHLHDRLDRSAPAAARRPATRSLVTRRAVRIYPK